MAPHLVFGTLAFLSLGLLLWQWKVGGRFPLHQRVRDASFAPPVTVLKPLKGRDETTEACLRSWFAQHYGGSVQILFGVASAEDPVCALVRRLLQEYPGDAQLVVCGPLAGANAKVSKLAQIERLARHEILVISDADVLVPPDLLANIVAPLNQPQTGLVNCFYFLANPSTVAMRWEAVAINADFWSQVLQSNSLKPMDFALGAVMATRRAQLAEIGGFPGLVDCLADDYQLGHRIAGRGYRIVVSPVIVECWSALMGWIAVWKHQLRWARTVRVCQPVPYFFSILSNGTLWPLVWVLARPGPCVLAAAVACWVIRIWAAVDLEKRLTRLPARLVWSWLPLLKDLLQTAIWLLAFLGNRIEWRGERMKLRKDGTLSAVKV